MIEQSIYAILTDPTVPDIASSATRLAMQNSIAATGAVVRPIALAQSDPLPALVYEVEEDVQPVYLDGTPMLHKEALVNVFVQTSTRLQAGAVADSLKALLAGFRTTGTNAAAGHAILGSFHEGDADREYPPQAGDEKPRYEILRQFKVLYI